MNTMKQAISHIGRVVSIEGEHVRVLILQSSACATCEAHRLCQSAESKEKVVDVYQHATPQLQVGQEVRVVASMRMGMRAVTLAYVLPLILLIAVLSLITYLTGDELIGSAAGLGSLIPYYVGIYLCRNRIARDISFKIQ